MARLRSTLPPPPAPDVDAEDRWRVARWLFMAHDPGTPAEAIYNAVRAEYGRLAALDLPVTERLAALEVFLAEHGWLEGARRQLDYRTRQA